MHAQGTALPARQGTAGQGPAGDSRRIAYTVAEVAKLLGKHVNTIYGWVGSGALPSQRIGGTIYIPKWALASLVAPDAGDELAAALTPGGGEAA
jgi:excisionase family DNA binding protein